MRSTGRSRYDDSPEARALFDRISPGMVSPIPGGTSFVNHRDARGESIGGDAGIGDRDQRWEWIRDVWEDEGGAMRGGASAPAEQDIGALGGSLPR